MLAKIQYFFFQKYENSDFITRQRVKILLSICVTLIFVVCALMITYIIQRETDPGVIFPIAISGLILIASITLIKYGYFAVAANTILFVSMIAAWITIFTESGELLARLDTVAIIIGFMTFTSLLVSKRSVVIIGYIIANSLLLFVSTFYLQRQLKFTNEVMFEYIIDTFIGMASAGVASLLIFTINKHALQKADEATKIAEAEAEKNRELNLTLEQKVLGRTEALQATMAALQRSETKFRSLYDSTSDAVMLLDEKGFFDCNKATLTIFGCASREEFITKHLADFSPPQQPNGTDSMVLASQMIATAVEKGSLHFDWMHKRNDTGEIFPADVLLNALELDGKKILQAVVRDITERKQAEEELRQSEEKYRTIIESIEDGYVEVDFAGNWTFVNDVICKHMKYSREELLGMDFRKLHTESSAKRSLKAFGEVHQTGKPLKSLEVEGVRKDGTIGNYELSVSLMKDAKEQPIGFRCISRDITERKQAEKKLKESENKYRLIADNMTDSIAVMDMNLRFTYISPSIMRMRGYTPEEAMAQTLEQAMTPESLLLVSSLFEEEMQREASGTAEPDRVRIIELEEYRKDMSKICVEVSLSFLRDAQGRPTGLLSLTRDITERKQAEDALLKSEESYRTLVENAQDIIFGTDDTGHFTIVNSVMLRITGYSQEEIIGKHYKMLVRPDKFKEVITLFASQYENRVQNTYHEFPIITKDGHEIWLGQNTQLLVEDDHVSGFQAVARDITERRRMEGEIQYLATHDTLTGLPNRSMFSQRLNFAIQTAQRYNRQFAVLFIDLDRFKIINDTLGHEAGDQLLQEIAARLTQSLRAVDVVGRLGGDEFVILIDEVSDPNHVAIIAHKILASIIKPITLMGQQFRITASIGICMYPKDAQDEQSLMKNADIAMYLAKEEGKNNYQFYSKDIQSKSLEYLSIETNLRFAIERNELYLHYQAKVDFKTNAITGVEALLRWQNPYLGSVTPTQFIPVAEETGLIIPIGRWVLKTVCAQNVAWQQQGLPAICTAVNLSLRQLTDDNLMDDIRTALDDSGMAPNLLELEITESMVMHNPDLIISILTKIKKMGVRLAIDDFGTGYSSLAQIQHFPIDTLKVDRSFIHNIPKDAEDMAITEAIIAMGKTLSLTVVAEGVGTEEQMKFLKEHSCDEMQGYYFSKPIVPEQFADLLRQHVPSPSSEKQDSTKVMNLANR